MTINRVYLGIGSNIDRDINIRDGLKELQSRYGELSISPVYESKSLGFDGDDFYNLVVGLNTELDIDALGKQLREVEYQFGRNKNEIRYSSRTLDIDLLMYADHISETHHVPRSDIIEFSFVLKPLFDIAPNLQHPLTGQTMAQLWENFDSAGQIMRPIPQSFNL